MSYFLINISQVIKFLLWLFCAVLNKKWSLREFRGGNMYILEACIDSVESAIAAVEGGADRAELCSNLIIGGTSPSIELFNTINEVVDLKLNVLIRPRFGDFCYTEHEFEIIRKEVELFKKAGANAVVIGVLNPDGTYDMERMKILMDTAGDMDVTVHRSFDVTSNPHEALEDLISLGVKTILTSGQESTALKGMELLSELQDSTDKIEIMAGSGVNADVVKEFLEKTNIKSYHLSGKEIIDSKMTFRKERVPMGLSGFSEFDIWRTNSENIRKVKELLK